MAPRVTAFAVAGYAQQAAGNQDVSGITASAVQYEQVKTAVAVSFAENALHDVGAINHNSNGTDDYGLWQINSVHTQYDREKLLTDPLYNAVAAFQISNGFTNFGPWRTYTDGAYKAHLAQAANALATANEQGPTAFQEFAGSIHNPLTTLESWTKYAAKLLANLTSGSFWKRIGFGVVGFVLVLFALLLLFRRPISKVIP